MQGFDTNQYPSHLLMQLSQLFPASGPQEIQYMAKALYTQNQERSQVNPASPMGLEFNYSAPSTQYNQAYSFNCSSPFAYERNGNLSNISTSPSMSSMIGEKKEVFEDEYSSDFTHAFEYSNTPINQQFEDDQTERDSEKLLTASKKINKDKSFSQSCKPKDQQFRSRRGLWSEEDDAQLRELVAEHGQKWSLIGSIMGDRKGKQVRDRYMNTSRPDINHSQWTEEEDELFLTLFDKYGNKWCQIAAEMPGRTENQVKNKFYCLKRSNKVKKSSKKASTKAKKGKTIDQVSASTSENYSPIKQTEVKDTSLFKDIDCFFDFTGEESNSCEFAPASNYNNNKGSIWAMI